MGMGENHVMMCYVSRASGSRGILSYQGQKHNALTECRSCTRIKNGKSELCLLLFTSIFFNFMIWPSSLPGIDRYNGAFLRRGTKVRGHFAGANILGAKVVFFFLIFFCGLFKWKNSPSIAITGQHVARRHTAKSVPPATTSKINSYA